MIPEKLKKFLQDGNNQILINENTKESWEEIYRKLPTGIITGGFTQIILDSGINDPASIMGYIPSEYLYKQNINSYKIPDGVMRINDQAFRGCSNLKSIIIPDSVTSIKWSVFCGCSNLTNVTIPNSVTSIDSYAFEGCSSLTKIIIPNSVTSIGAGAFQNCSSLTNITIPNSVEIIEDWGFRDCDNLTRITIGYNLTKIGEHAFGYCTKLKEIQFQGTKKEWDSIEKESSWRADSSIERIICTDGVIELL